jgi:hypothetical protein
MTVSLKYLPTEASLSEEENLEKRGRNKKTEKELKAPGAKPVPEAPGEGRPITRIPPP